MTKRITIINCNIMGYWEGISIHNATDVSFKSNLVYNNSHGIVVDFGARNTILSNNRIAYNAYNGILIGTGNAYDMVLYIILV